MLENPEVSKDAALSVCGRYRWSLSRQWAQDVRTPWVGWVMLNPSTADASIDDPTIRRCIDFSRRWGYGGLAVRNLFNIRATDPDELLKARAGGVPLVCENDDWRGDRWASDDLYLGMAEVCPLIIVAWGAHPAAQVDDRASYVLKLLMSTRSRIACIGITGDGHPRHPLYRPRSVTPIDFPIGKAVPT